MCIFREKGFREGERLRLESQTDHGTTHSLLQESNAKRPNLSVFPKKEQLTRRETSLMKKRNKNTRKTQKDSTPQGGGWWPRPPCKSLWHDTAKMYLGFIATTHILSSQFMDIEHRDINDILQWA